MTKAELIEKIAEDTDLTKGVAKITLDSMLDGITEALKVKDGKITLTGFGTFSKVHRKAYKGHNPQTGEPLKIKARNAVKFKVSQKLKDSI